MNKTDALHEGLKKMLNYLPMIYNQQPIEQEGEFIIKYPYESIPENAILFVLPLYNSVAKNNLLKIKFATVDPTTKLVTYTVTKTYNIFIEDVEGSRRAATQGDIVANRLCMFRFMSHNSSDIILCNNPTYNNLSCSTLCTIGAAKFYKAPEVVYYTGTGLEKTTPVALNVDLEALASRVLALENKIKFGTETIDQYLEKNPTTPEGTIYIQVEE